MLFRTTVAILAVLVTGANYSAINAQESVGGAPAPIVPAAGTIKDPSSYGMGFSVGRNLSQDGFSDKDLDKNDFLLGLLDALNKKEPKLTQPQFQAAMEALQQRMQSKMIEQAKKNLEKANVYLEANKKKDGIQTLKSGLQYQVLKSGTGKVPTLTDTVLCHYEGKLIDGTVFDSTLKRNEPAKFGVSQVPPGWIEALQRMKVGDKWVLTLPPNLGFGEQGSPPNVAPNEALIIELELLDIVKK